MKTTNVAAAIYLVDSGPLVAAADQREPHHAWAVAQLRSLAPPLLTCEAVISETAFLLERARLPAAMPMHMAERSILQVESVVRSIEDATALRQLMVKYSNVPMSFADACLVRLAERFPAAQLLTFDSDFRIYRTANQHAIPLLAPSL